MLGKLYKVPSFEKKRLHKCRGYVLYTSCSLKRSHAMFVRAVEIRQSEFKEPH